MATTATAPRKDATTFEQTWDQTDAASLDPTSLPIQRLPRAWERKQEVRTVGNGKKKEIWRRHGTRSRTSNTTPEEDPENDERVRPVKRQQRLSPKAAEKSANSRFGRTRAFKATRWDRRKSVLPRKKTIGAYDPNESLVEEEDEEQDTSITSLDNNSSFSEITTTMLETEKHEPGLLPETEDRRATFTFSMESDKPTPSARPDMDSSTVDHADEEATISRLFRSSIQTTSVATTQSSETLSYPELPISPDSGSAGLEQLVEQDAPQGNIEATNVSPTKTKQTGNVAADDGLLTVVKPSADEISTQCSEVQSLPTDAIIYPSLPAESHPEDEDESMEDAEESEYAAALSPEGSQDESEDFELDDSDDLENENFTEASLQLDIQRAMKTERPYVSGVENSIEGVSEQTPLAAEPSSTTNFVDDITSGLTLGPPVPPSREPTPRKLRSPSPPPRTENGPEDTTMTFAFDDDTALLKDFLSRAAASKANKSENIARRESLQNRRDSDVVRHALASPRKALEDKDPNSPSKHDIDATLDLSQTLTLSMETSTPLSPSNTSGEGAVDAEDSKAEISSRRSSRTKKSRLPAPSSIPTGPPKISVKRDGGDPVILKKTNAQELSLLTRNNTRKNKLGAMAVNVRLLKLSNDARTTKDSVLDSTDSVVQAPGKKYVRWDSQLAYFQEDTQAIANALADAESLATPDELSSAPPSALPTKLKTPKVPKDKNTIPKVRKVKNLGSANGTPGKGLLIPASLLPDSMLESKDEPREKRLPKPKVTRVKKPASSASDTAPAPPPTETQLAVLEIAPVGVDPDKTGMKERKSRLATPRKVKLPQPSSSVLGDGKENQSKGVAAAAASKKSIVAPSVVIPPMVEAPSITTGLPRRRGRKL